MLVVPRLPDGKPNRPVELPPLLPHAELEAPADRRAHEGRTGAVAVTVAARRAPRVRGRAR
eukprot:1056756-Alexandrium_andersonii.AAC.1